MNRKEFESIKRKLTRVKVIYTDMDGTLAGPEGSIFTAPDGRFTLLPAKAIVKVLKRGVDVVIVSGRTRSQLRESARTLGFKNYIAESGCEIVYELGKEIVYNLGDMKMEKGRFPRNLIEESGAVKLLFSKFPGKIRYYTPWSEEVEDNIILVGNIDVKKANKILKDHGFFNLRITDNGKVPPEPDFSHPHCYHLMPEAAGKRSAVRKDKQIRGLRKEELVGIGESIEDIEIAPEVGVYFVVRNGAEGDPRISEAIQKANNIFLLDERMGLGWAQAIDILEQLGKMG